MELNSKAIHDVIHPTAAFVQRETQPDTCSWNPTSKLPAAPWDKSQLNPKNRIDSLEPLDNPLWRIDGCTGLGTQFFAVPLFLDDAYPMRFDVFISEKVASSRLLRDLLDLDAALHTKDGARVARLGISRHIVRTLQLWTARVGLTGPASVTDMYQNLPFGSRIIFENLELNISDINIQVVAMHNLEHQLLSISKLHTMLGLPRDALPDAVDIKRLRFIQQLQDSVCLVYMDGVSDGEMSAKGLTGPWILKALTSGPKYLYHELRALLTMPPHQHVVSRPAFLVTKLSRFGNKTAVVGFILPYYSGGGLRDLLPLLRMQGRLTLQQQLRWALQLTSAVLHVRERGKIFYPDLRLDNVVLTSSGDIVMVDFEQRGVWCEFASPEVNAIEYIRILAMAESSSADDAGSREDGQSIPDEISSADDSESGQSGPSIPKEVQQWYADMLSRLLPGWEAIADLEDYLPPHERGGHDAYNIPWLCLDETEREAAEVYMLGRVLWCLFEGQSAPQPGAVWQSYRREPDLEFPAYRRTPTALRGLVDACTRGRRPVLSSLITRRGSQLVLRSVPQGMPQDPGEILAVARDWWTKEMGNAEAFLLEREEKRKRDTWNGNYYGRPKLRDVLVALEDFES